MNSSLTTHYEDMVRQALAETRLATRVADLASAQAKITDSKVEWFKWILPMLLALAISTQLYFAYTINARLDRLEASVGALLVRMDGLEEKVHQLSVWQQEHNDLYRHKER